MSHFIIYFANLNIIYTTESECHVVGVEYGGISWRANTKGFRKVENKDENYFCKTIKDSWEDINAGKRLYIHEKRQGDGFKYKTSVCIVCI